MKFGCGKQVIHSEFLGKLLGKCLLGIWRWKGERLILQILCGSQIVRVEGIDSNSCPMVEGVVEHLHYTTAVSS
jgi:hypothetical protein